ncbi:MAG TPA: serine/threonine-protein kinase [Thermoanaerobaculia bacterium]|nr:serine/threonine-protein kinase [Thermoanaerobaculia bacterium]
MPTGLATASVDERARRRSPASAPVGRLASSDSIDAGGFTPGTVLLERYRIIGLLGRGGMGEVYRADDLKLGQPVALKFLPTGLGRDPSRLERFYAEVRIARQVSHPNVCRVYDVGEVDGRNFLSMEFVDGEDLASLLKRIGRLPPDKALEIARELAAGLAAAHDKGVLHRDLKPANVMIDGRGRARITDFGLAVVAADAVEGEVSGTPTYMAPEQLAGKGVSVRSDIYSLGLVLYELYTGRKVYEAATLADLIDKRAGSPPSTPSSVSPGLDPAVDRVIMRCLEADPRARPSSAAHVAAALPGGDPLAAAIAAGETPSPEMVAAAGAEGALSAGRAWTLLGGIAACTVAALLLAPVATDLGVAPLPKSPDALNDRSRELAQKLGYGDHPADTAFWWQRQARYLRYRADHIPSPERVRELATIEPHPWWFWYRQSPRPMAPANDGSDVGGSDPPLEISGMVRLAVDARGNLVSLTAAAPQIDTPPGPWPNPDWTTLFREAALEPARFSSSSPRWVPPVAFDVRAEWDGTFAGQPKVPIHVAAAAYHGKAVYFEVLGPWNRPLRMEEAPRTFGSVASDAAVSVLLLSLLVLGAVIARRNLLLGRGDRRGAFRVSLFLFACYMIDWVLRGHHVVDFQSETNMFTGRLGQSLFLTAFVWLTYMALEPFVRRRWPDLLISWTRLLSGRFRDPLVGRDALIGVLFGCLHAAVYLAQNALPSWTNVSGMTGTYVPEENLGSPNALAGEVLSYVNLSIMQALAIMAMLVLSWVLLRRRWLAIGLTGLLLIFLDMRGENLRVEVPVGILVASLGLFVAIRFGLLSLAVYYLAGHFLSEFLFPLDLSRWYGGREVVLLLLLAGIAVYAFRTALGGKPAFGGAALEEG